MALRRAPLATLWSRWAPTTVVARPQALRWGRWCCASQSDGRKALLEEYDEDEAQKLAAEDWERDSKGADEIEKSQLEDAMFELADLCAATSCPSHQCVAMRMRWCCRRVCAPEAHAPFVVATAAGTLAR